MAVVPTGPPYPYIAPGSNAIGVGAIGEMQIGAIPAFNAWVPILSQYRNSPNLDSMILAFNSAMDQTENISNLFDFIWNVLTATGFGLNVWGRIVNISRTVAIPGGIQYLGFDEAGVGNWTGFGQGILFSGGLTTFNYVFDDTDYRRMILAKAATNIWNGSIPAFNQILLNLFPERGLCYVADNQNMSITLNFHFVLSPQEIAIVEFSGALPAPCGVAVSISQL